MDRDQHPDPHLLSELRHLGARMLDDAPPVTTAEAMRHAAGARDPLVSWRNCEVPIARLQETIGSGPSPGRRPGVLIGAAAAAAVVAVGLGVISRNGAEPDAVGVASPTSLAAAPSPEAPPSTEGATPGPGAATPLPADAALAWPPRILLDDSWSVVTASERSVDEGYVSFERDGVVVWVGWYRGPGASARPQDGNEVGSATLLGQDVVMRSGGLAYRAGDVAALAEDGVVADEQIAAEAAAADPDELIGGPILDEALADAIAGGLIDGVATQGLQASLVENAASLSVQVVTADPSSTLTDTEFADVLAGARQFAQAEWEAVMPDRVVTPGERDAVIDELLTGVPLPDGWSPSGPAEATLTQDRADLAGSLTASVSCAWVNRYFTADATTDAAREALDAIATIPSWPSTQVLTASWEQEEPGVVPTPNNDAVGVTVEGDTLMYNGEQLDGFFAAQLCDMNAVG